MLTNAILARALARDSARPLLTYYDDSTGERVELSARTLDNWVAKTANLLVDGCGLGAGDSAALLLPPHWQTAAITLACWSAGLAIDHGSRGTAPSHADVVFAAATRSREALALGSSETYLLSLAPLGARLPSVPGGALDFAAEVPSYGDVFTSTANGDTAALTGTVAMTHSELVTAAEGRAAELGLTEADRVMIVESAEESLRPLDWLLAPLVAGASVVLVRKPDTAVLTARAASERVTATFGVAVDGLRSLSGPSHSR